MKHKGKYTRDGENKGKITFKDGLHRNENILQGKSKEI